MDTERDLTDLGVKWTAEVEERGELAPDEVFVRPAMTARDREQAVARLREQMGWGASRAARLAAACGCGAAPGEWCPRPGRRRSSRPGRLCATRGTPRVDPPNAGG